MGQQQWQGMERRQSQGSYIGEERRKTKPVFEEPAADQKDAQQARAQQQARDPNQH